MDELISKRAVIEAIEKARANVGHNLERSIGKSIIEILDDVGRDVDRLPSAHGTNLAEVGTDCISRQAAIDALKRKQDDGKGDLSRFYNTIIQHDIEAIMQLPSAQPEIIRCKDCKHWMPYEWMFSEVWQSQNIDDYPEDEISCNYCDVHMKSSDFCSRAVRREVTT